MRKKTESSPTEPARRPAAKEFLPTGNGTSAVFACLLSALLVPYLLRTAVFAFRGAGLTPALQGAISLVAVALASVFLGVALLRILNLPMSSDAAAYAGIRLFCFVAPAFYLEFSVFRFCFSGDSWLPRGVLFLILALLSVYAATHTVLWAAAILYEFDAIFPSPSLWGTTWKLQLRNPISAIGRFLPLLLTCWGGAVIFPLLSRKVLPFLYGTIPGTILLSAVYAAVLTVFVRAALRAASGAVLRAFPAEETDLVPEAEDSEEAKNYDIEFAARDNARNNPSSAEELLIERGLLTREAAYGKPAARITDGDIPAPKPLLPEKWTLRDFVPLLIVALLLIFLAGTALFNRTTAAGVVSGIVTATQEKAAAELKSGRTADASREYMNGLGDLEAFDAYLNAIAGGVDNERLNEESAQLETYSELFKTAESYSDTSSLPYLLEAKLLLKDGRPELAAEVLEYMIDYEYATDETYLLLLTSLREAGKTDSASYKNARKVCISRRAFTDTLSYLDPLTGRDASVIADSMQDSKTAFYRNGQLLLWQSYRESGEIETAYNGLSALLADGRFSEDLDVIRAFIETGSAYHVRFDGTTEGIDEAHEQTASYALLYDRLYTVSLAAHESTGYTLLEVKHFVANALVACRQYPGACEYLAEALGRYSSDEDLINLYRIAYTGLTDEERETIPAYEALQFHR